MREMYAACGRMILCADSHTRYGAVGTMGFGEGGGEIVKQMLGKPYELNRPEVICVLLSGAPQPGVGPHDVALAIIGATFRNGFVKNKVMEFTGEGVGNLSMDFRNGIDIMTTEASCLSSIWETDEKTALYLKTHGREGDYKKLGPSAWAYYDGLVKVDLSKIRPMIALPFHPSNTYTIEELNENCGDILRKVELDMSGSGGRKICLTGKIAGGRLKADQGIIAGCAGGTFENILAADSIIKNGSVGNDRFSFSVYPASSPVMMDLIEKGAYQRLTRAGAVMRSAFCGPCFGAGDVPFHDGFSIRHTTRNFPYREGARPGDGQIASVALMDARSIAATAISGGILTPATDIAEKFECPDFIYDGAVYASRIYNGFGNPRGDISLEYGPNIVDWPEMPGLADDILIKIVSCINDPVTTTDELIPSGETSSYRSNPIGLAEYTLSRRDPGYVERAKAVREMQKMKNDGAESAELGAVFSYIRAISGFGDLEAGTVSLGSAIYAVKPGDGSAREQAASCQRVLGGNANIAREYATKRYRSNLINWGIIPFTTQDACFETGDYIFVPGIREAVLSGGPEVTAYLFRDGIPVELKLSFGELTPAERRILAAGCMINDYRCQGDRCQRDGSLDTFRA